jgi:hypothetical protein
MVEIETARLRLGQFTSDDLDDLFWLYSDVEEFYLICENREHRELQIPDFLKKSGILSFIAIELF